MPSQYAPPNEDARLLLLERTTLAGVFIMCISYGIEFLLYLFTLRELIQCRKSQRRSHCITMISYVSILFVLATIAAGCVINDTISEWVDNREYPGGPVIYGLDNGRRPTYLTTLMAYNVMSFFQDGYLLYRFFVIWDFNRLVLIFPFLLYLATMVISTYQWALILKSGTAFLSSSHVDIGLVSWILTVATSLVLTLLIILRIQLARRGIVKFQSSPELARKFSTVTSVLIESQAVYAVVGIVVLASVEVNIDVVNVLANTFGILEAIAPTLVVYQVVRSRSPSDHHSTLSTIHYASTSVGEELPSEDNLRQANAPSFGWEQKPV